MREIEIGKLYKHFKGHVYKVIDIYVDNFYGFMPSELKVENSTFFDSFQSVREVLAAMVQYTQVQAKCYDDLKTEIVALRKDYKDAQVDALKLTKETQQAVKVMTDKIAELKKPEEK